VTSATEPPGPSAGLANLLVGVAASLAGHRDALNRLDGVAGDGDLGLTVTQAAEAIAAIAPTIRILPAPEAIRAAGTEIARKAPSTSGTLVAFAFLAAGRVGEVDAEGDGARAVPYLEAAAESIATRGKVSVGDRTMLDALRPGVDAFRTAVERGKPVAEAVRAAATAADEGAVATAVMTPTVGRAAWLADRARDHEDAGARLVALAFDAAAGYLEGGAASSERR
jgi:phosphoenolpyruvate---glycerone phosphotransferase subunit DhaL